MTLRFSRAIRESLMFCLKSVFLKNSPVVGQSGTVMCFVLFLVFWVVPLLVVGRCLVKLVVLGVRGAAHPLKTRRRGIGKLDIGGIHDFVEIIWWCWVPVFAPARPPRENLGLFVRGGWRWGWVPGFLFCFLCCRGGCGGGVGELWCPLGLNFFFCWGWFGFSSYAMQSFGC